MKQLLVLFVAIAATGLAQLQPVSGTIIGVLKGEDGSTLQHASIILHLVTKSVPRLRQQTTSWISGTGAGGAFQFPALPQGNYTLCPSVPNSIWLNPCEWNFPTPVATLTGSSPNASVTITLKRGVAIQIRINDLGQLLAQSQAKTPGAGLLLEVSDPAPGSFFRVVPLASQDSSGWTHRIVIPFSTPLTLFIHPTLYRVADASGAPLTQGVTAKIPPLVASGQQVSPINFTITGVGAQ